MVAKLCVGALSLVTAAGCAGIGASAEQLTARATFDLECPAPQIEVHELANRVRGVVGCGRRLAYVEVCETRPDGTHCAWVINAPAWAYGPPAQKRPPTPPGTWFYTTPPPEQGPPPRHAPGTSPPRAPGTQPPHAPSTQGPSPQAPQAPNAQAPPPASGKQAPQPAAPQPAVAPPGAPPAGSAPSAGAPAAEPSPGPEPKEPF